MTPPSVADNEVEITDEQIALATAQFRAVVDDGYDDDVALVSALETLGLYPRAALAASDRDGKWQPIETAPRDGTKIDVWVRCFSVEDAGKVSCEDRGRYPDVYWGKQVEIYTGPYERRESDGDGWVYRDDLHWLFIESGDYRVTHWMPLPLPPSDALQTGERATSPDPVSPPSTQP